MNNKITYNESYLNEIGYSKSPTRQILMLKISSKAQLFLLSFFTHSKDYKISHKQIDRMFSSEINLQYIKQYLDELKEKKYLTENNNTYFIDLKQIQSDYLVCSKLVEQRRKMKNLNSKQYRKKTEIN